MRVAFSVRDKMPAGGVAEAEIYFDADGPFRGLKLTGFLIRTGERGLWVAGPSREYKDKSGERKFWGFLRSADDADKKAIYRFNDWVLEKYREQNASDASE